VPSIANADTGVPIIFVTLPAMVIALVPIVIIEAYVMARHLKLSFKRILKAAIWGNILSTIAGIPIAWGILVAIEIFTGGDLNSPIRKFLAVTLQAPWPIPYESYLYWMISAAKLVLLVPFFFVSWWIENKVEKRILKDVQRAQLNIAVRNANLASYGLLAMIVLILLIAAKP